MKSDPPMGPLSSTELDLTAEEALLLSRVDGQRTLREIAELSGIGEERARDIVEDLARRGAVDLGSEGESPQEEPGEPVAAEGPFGGLLLDEVTAERGETGEVAPEPDDLPPNEEPDARGDQAPEPPSEDAAADAEEAAAEEANYRKTFESKFHGLAPDARAGLAPLATGGDLCALCLDPDPKVVLAVLTNATFGLQHARLIAFHHRTAAGLDHVASRGDLVRDGLVFRRLLRNPQLAAATLRRLMQSRRLLEIYKAAIDRDVPELARTTFRGLLRTKFSAQAQPEERAELVMNTEARVLQLLSGCTFDARTTQILCGKQVYSALFIQNVARFGATPPMLLAHLAKLPFVRRNPGLKKALMQHPNLPGDVKRSM